MLSLHSRLAGLDSDYRYRPARQERATAGPRASSHDHHRRDQVPSALGAGGACRATAIWWLLRLTPPSPQLVVFPPTRLLKDLKTTEEEPARSPWWLTALRMLLAALIILALARPCSIPTGRVSRHGPPPRRHRQWLGLGRALVRAPRGNRSGDRPRRARRPHHRACAFRARPAGQRSFEPG